MRAKLAAAEAAALVDEQYKPNVEALRRQDEIENARDLTKSQVSGQMEAEQPDPVAGIEDPRASARVTA